MTSSYLPSSAAKDSRVVVALAAADGLAYGFRLLELLQSSRTESHLVVSRAAAAAPGFDIDAVRGLADQVYAEANQAARISSGSFLTRGMIVAPCDPGSLAAIAMGLATNLVYRAADVTLKEARPLVLGVPAAALTRVSPDMLERASSVPGLTVLPLEGPVDRAVGALLTQLGIDDIPSGA
jgi:flavin prenyltransferase